MYDLKKLARFLGKNGLLNGQKRRFLRNFWIQFNFKGKNGAGMIPAPSLSTVCNILIKDVLCDMREILEQ